MRLWELANVFFLEGLLGFGGPAAHLAMMEEDTVRKRQWLTQEQFLDTLAASNLIPGPTSTEMAIHIGYIYAGIPGLIVAGISFILPAALITLGFAWLYSQIGTVPAVARLFAGVGPVVLVIIADACWRLAKKSITNLQLALIFLLVIASVLLGLSEIAALILGGILAIVLLPKAQTQSLLIGIALVNSTSKLVLIKPTLLQLGLFFLKIGSILFGGGYVLFAFLQEGMVNQNHWLSQQQLVDAIAIGQFTPGPILSSATFIGYLIAGLPGALVATLAIFLPSFVLVLISNPLIAKMRKSKLTSFFLDGIRSASIALIAVVVLRIGYNALSNNWVNVFLTILSAIMLFGYRVKTRWLIILALVAGYFLEQP